MAKWTLRGTHLGRWKKNMIINKPLQYAYSHTNPKRRDKTFPRGPRAELSRSNVLAQADPRAGEMRWESLCVGNHMGIVPYTTSSLFCACFVTRPSANAKYCTANRSYLTMHVSCVAPCILNGGKKCIHLHTYWVIFFKKKEKKHLPPSLTVSRMNPKHVVCGHPLYRVSVFYTTFLSIQYYILINCTESHNHDICCCELLCVALYEIYGGLFNPTASGDASPVLQWRYGKTPFSISSITNFLK